MLAAPHIANVHSKGGKPVTNLLGVDLNATCSGLAKIGRVTNVANTPAI